MGAILTYHVRAGQLTSVAAGRVFTLPTHRDPSSVLSWEKAQQLKPGKYTLWDHCFDLPDQHSRGLRSLTDAIPAETVIRRVSLGTASPATVQLRVSDLPGMPQHIHSGSAVYVGDRRAGVFIHGWPPCNLKRCVVVLRQWDDLVRAVASEAELSFAIAF